MAARSRVPTLLQEAISTESVEKGKTVKATGIRRNRLTTMALVGVVSVGLMAACGGSPGKNRVSAAAGPVTMTLGYFPNITHAAAVAGVE